MDALVAIHTRRSIKRLSAPAPSEEDLHEILEAATMAPDHKTLAPWHFLIIEGDDRVAFGEVLAGGLLSRVPEASDGQLDKERSKPLRAPMIIAVAAKRIETSLEFSELIAATCAATQNLLLAAHALGYGTIWRTGAPVGCNYVKAQLGFEQADELVGFIYIGTPAGELPTQRKPSVEDVVSRWVP